MLTAFGIDPGHQSWRLRGQYTPREYCVRYHETAAAFIYRLLEQEGIYCHSESGDQGEILASRTTARPAFPSMAASSSPSAKARDSVMATMPSE